MSEAREQNAIPTWTCEWCGNVAFSSEGYDSHKELCDERIKFDPHLTAHDAAMQEKDKIREMWRLKSLELFPELGVKVQ